MAIFLNGEEKWLEILIHGSFPPPLKPFLHKISANGVELQPSYSYPDIPVDRFDSPLTSGNQSDAISPLLEASIPASPSDYVEVPFLRFLLVLFPFILPLTPGVLPLTSPM